MDQPVGTASASVAWDRVDDPAPPVVETVPYIELTLEHPGLEATGLHGDGFPVAVPYRLGNERRVFFWRPAWSGPDAPPDAWAGLCATTHGLWPVVDGEPAVPRLWTRRGRVVDVVVDGTVAADSLTAPVEGYVEPRVVVRRLTAAEVELDVDGEVVVVPSGTRSVVEVPARRVTLAGGAATTDVHPRLVVRYPGRRTVVHPAVGGTDAVFPTFGLDLDRVPNPVAVPTVDGELDDRGLATALGVDLDARPYAEGVLWQAFAYQAFDVRREAPARLARSAAGPLVLANPQC